MDRFVYPTRRERAEREVRYARNRESLIEARFQLVGYERRFYIYGLPRGSRLDEDVVRELNESYRLHSVCCEYCVLLYFTVSSGRLVFVLRGHKVRDIAVAVHQAVAEMFDVVYDMQFDDGRGNRFMHRLGMPYCTDLIKAPLSGRRGYKRGFDRDQGMLFEGINVEGASGDE